MRTNGGKSRWMDSACREEGVLTLPSSMVLSNFSCHNFRCRPPWLNLAVSALSQYGTNVASGGGGEGNITYDVRTPQSRGWVEGIYPRQMILSRGECEIQYLGGRHLCVVPEERGKTFRRSILLSRGVVVVVIVLAKGVRSLRRQRSVKFRLFCNLL